MDHHSGYRGGLVAEYRGCLENGQPDRAAAVRAELERTGGLPDDFEDAADHSAKETAVPRRARQNKET
jgi:hypothetical protein